MTTRVRASMLLARREFVRTLRQPAHVLATILTPVIVWVFFASGFEALISTDASGYRGYLAPGIALLVVVFASLYAAMTLTDERERAWIVTVTAEGVSPGSIALGKLAAGSIVATGQAGLVLAAAPVLGAPASLGGFVGSLAALALASVGAGGVAAWLACVTRTSRAFHGLINLAFMPAWMLSGALFPLETAAGWMRAITIVNPGSWAHAVASSVFAGETPGLLPASGLLGFAFAGVVVARWGIARIGR
jgi:ABC-2 type transport system permease protein